MNLELPFPESELSIDDYAAEMDEALEPLFLEAVGAELERLRAARAAGVADDDSVVA